MEYRRPYNSLEILPRMTSPQGFGDEPQGKFFTERPFPHPLEPEDAI